MNEQKRILGNCFRSNSPIWNDYLSQKGETNISYYPSAGEDLRPMLFSKTESLNYSGIDLTDEDYFEPDLFIFSDYFPWSTSRFFDSTTLYSDKKTSLTIEGYCELNPNPQFYTYQFNRLNVDCEPSNATGHAIFFKVKIQSHINGGISYYKHGIYFFYENVNLIEQLFIRHQLAVSHIVWKRDGGGLAGGGKFHLEFMFALASLLGVKFYFLWCNYLDKKLAHISQEDYARYAASYPIEIKEKLPATYQLVLKKMATFIWCDDHVNLYFKRYQEVLPQRQRRKNKEHNDFL